MDLDFFSVDQGCILDEQTQDTLPLAVFDTRVIPDMLKISSQGEQLIPCLRIDQQALFLCLLLVLFLRLGEGTELVVPFRFETIDDKTVIGVDIHVTTASELGLVSCSLNVLSS
jgi:hypothetical protein